MAHSGNGRQNIIYIGWGWGLSLFILIGYLLGSESDLWPFVAFWSLLFWGMEMELPERDIDA